jgi:hypothetical protein
MNGVSPMPGRSTAKQSVMARELFDDAAPQHAVGRHAVDEENGIAFILVYAMHGVASFFHRQRGASCWAGCQTSG